MPIGPFITVRPWRFRSCGTVPWWVHNHYRRHVTDPPLWGRNVQLVVTARRFRCDAPSPTTYWLHVQARKTRFASGQTNRHGISGAAPKMRQNQYCRPNNGRWKNSRCGQDWQDQPSGLSGAL
ncbi:transposase family protein [Bradyrhizobium sp. Arg816]|uniref:transposase family protein n=1 Tax=Bradyrhizobium sp. Arg816 TaxID=2998491 RepID=UPI0034D48FBA